MFDRLQPDAELVAATVRTVSTHTDAAASHEQWWMADGFRERFPKLAELLNAAEFAALAYFGVPRAH